jgi:hypothetical protein
MKIRKKSHPDEFHWAFSTGINKYFKVCSNCIHLRKNLLNSVGTKFHAIFRYKQQLLQRKP